MPWGKRKDGDKVCVYKKDTGETLHCYSGKGADAEADKYLAALYANAGDEAKEVGDGLFMNKEADGRWLITAVSTAAFRDLDNETFTTQAMDYEIKEVQESGDFPEFRMFHRPWLKIGKVEKMIRVGNFAVDQGHSYDDAFSKEVCEKLLSKNTSGKWRISRGFWVYKAQGNCPKCSSDMIISKEHMKVGFRCPVCKQVHMKYKGVLRNVRFLETKTFDVSVTDRPCVPYTGVIASKDLILTENKSMTRQEWEEKLLKEGLSAEVIKERLDAIPDAVLKDMTDLPDAEAVLKQDGQEDEGGDTLVLDPSVMQGIRAIVKEELKEALDGMEFDIEDTPVSKEADGILAELKEIKDLLLALTQTDEEALKERLSNAPRNAKLRVARLAIADTFKEAAKSKGKKMPMMDEEDMADDEEAEEGDEEEKESDVLIQDASGQQYGTMTDFLRSR